MKHFFRATAVLAACCALLGGCQDKHEPLKPTVFACANLAST